MLCVSSHSEEDEALAVDCTTDPADIRRACRREEQVGAGHRRRHGPLVRTGGRGVQHADQVRGLHFVGRSMQISARTLICSSRASTAIPTKTTTPRRTPTSRSTRTMSYMPIKKGFNRAIDTKNMRPSPRIIRLQEQSTSSARGSAATCSASFTYPHHGKAAATAAAYPQRKRRQ